MGKQRRKPLPREVRQHLAVLQDTIAALLEGAPEHEVATFDRAAWEMRRMALLGGADKRKPAIARSLDFPELVGLNLKRLREESGWTQAEVAVAMTRAGFDFKRITVAEIEGATRRISLEELLGFALLFGEPMFALLLPGLHDYLRFRDVTLDPADANKLMLGDAGSVQPSRSQQAIAARVLSSSTGARDWRPAKDIQERRGLGYTKRDS